MHPVFATLGNIATGPVGIGVLAASQMVSVQKLIRAAHAKEKQLPKELVQPPESP